MSICSNLYVIAAICGNFWQESQVNPGVWEGWTVGNPGFGLGQWTDNPPAVMRRTALFNWLDANGYARDSGDGQLAFLVHENLWIPSSFQQSSYNTLTDYFQSTSTDISALTREWMYHWEGINDGSYQTRYDAAVDFYDVFINSDGTREPWYAKNERLTRGQARWNSLRVMDFFLGEEPGPGPGPDEPTEEEILAIVRTALRRRRKGGGIIVF